MSNRFNNRAYLEIQLNDKATDSVFTYNQSGNYRGDGGRTPSSVCNPQIHIFLRNEGRF
jgi:hypothetical protein